MNFPMNFIAATHDYADYDRQIPAPLLRRTFFVEGKAAKASLLITGLGFYRIFMNGTEITKGILAPYISNPDQIVYYDQYDVAEYLVPGENVIGILLGNGMQNPFGGYIWEFDKARWRGSPMTAIRLEGTTEKGSAFSVESGEEFRIHPSALLFDELRSGEYYDARLELPGWSAPGFDDSGWENAIRVTAPRGETRLCEAEPIVVADTLKAVSITPYKEGYLYDFGVNTAGVCRLRVTGTAGQKISTFHGEWFHDGILDPNNINFATSSDPRANYVQCNSYICRGGGEEIYTPAFAYYGFRYVYVSGVTQMQASPELLTYLVMHSDLKECGGFSCSDDTANTLQLLTRRSTLANFFYFPTDCPQREKNGWTADAALSAEHTLLNLEAEHSYKEWLRNVSASLDPQGALPGIVPTAGWGYGKWAGPAWDCALTYLPYYVYRFRGDRDIVEENATPIFRYLNYLTTVIDKRGLITVGLGDWCPPGRGADQYKSPLAFTDTVIAMDIAKKAAFLFDVVGMTLQRKFAEALATTLRDAVRDNLINFSTMTAAGACQTSQAMAIYYNVFELGEKPAAFARLKEIIAVQGNHIDAGVLGLRILFHVLSDFDEADLAYEMITRLDYPSYGNWIARGATSLWEDFQPEGGQVNSMNHHFFGDISSWFIQKVGGLVLNPRGNDCNELLVAPHFIQKLTQAQSNHRAPAGEIKVRWQREKETIRLTISVPNQMSGEIQMPKGWTLQNGLASTPLMDGEFICTRSV